MEDSPAQSRDHLWRRRVIRFCLFVVILVAGLVVGNYGLRTQAGLASFFPQTCLGGWQNPKNATGEPDASGDFNTDNSATLNGAVSEIFCGDFSGEVPTDVSPKKFTLKFAWDIHDAPAPTVIEEIPPIEATTTDGSVQIKGDSFVDSVGDILDAPADKRVDFTLEEQPRSEPAAPAEHNADSSSDSGSSSGASSSGDGNSSSESGGGDAGGSSGGGESGGGGDSGGGETSWWWGLWNLSAIAESDTAGNILADDPGPLAAANDWLEVLYTLDSKEWHTLGFINRQNWRDSQIELPLDGWSDLSHLQVSLRSLPTFYNPVEISLDSLWIEVSYTAKPTEPLPTEDEISELPRLVVDDQEMVVTPERSFSPDQNPTFRLNPELFVDGGEVAAATSTPVATSTSAINSSAPVLGSEVVPLPQPTDLPSPTVEMKTEVSSPLPESGVAEPSDSLAPADNLLNSLWPHWLEQVSIAQSTPEAPPEAPGEPEGRILEVTATYLSDPDTTLTPRAVRGVDGWEVSLEPQKSFRPGIYNLHVEILRGNKVYVSDINFTWGVLAINTNKSIYSRGQDVYLQMASLNSGGHTICNANLRLDIATPDDRVVTLTTGSGEIIRNSTCGANNVTDEPDYYAHINPSVVGEYEMKLTNLDNGYQVTDSFLVQASAPLNIERVGATRINPFKADYRMRLRVTAESGFSGRLVEELPPDFEVPEAQDARVENGDDGHLVTWKLDLGAGESEEVSYVYHAPAVSPQFYLLGPAQLLTSEVASEADNTPLFQESRQWQIASDAACFSNASGNWSAAATWTSCGGTPPKPSDTVTIASPHIVLLDVSTTTSSVTINTGGTLRNNGTDQTLTLSGTSGTLLTRSGNFTASTSITVVMNPDASVTLLSGAFTGLNAFYKLQLTPTLTATRTYTVGGAFTASSSFDINPTSASSNRGLLVNLTGAVKVVPTATTTITGSGAGAATSSLSTTSTNYAFSSGHIDIKDNGNLKANASTITVNGTTTNSVLLALSGTGTFTADTSTVTLNADATTTALYGSFVGSNAFNILNLTPTITGGRGYTLGGAASTTGALTIQPVAASAFPFIVTMGGGITVGTSSTLTITRTTSATSQLDTTSTGYPLDVGKISIAAGGTLTANSSVITLYAPSGNLFANAGTFTQGTSEVKVVSAAGTPSLLSAATTFHKLTIDSPTTVVNMGSLALTINNAAGASLYVKRGVFNASGAAITGPGGSNGTLQIDSGATLCLGGTVGTTNTSATCDSSGVVDTTARAMPTFQTYTFDATSTVRYLSNANTAISRSPTYGHLVLAPIMTASRTYAIDLGALNINGDFRVTPWATVGTRALTVNLGGTTTVASYRTTLLDPYASNTPSITFRTNGVAKGLITGFLLNSSDGGGSTLIASSTIILNGTSSTLFTNTGTLTLTGSTVDFDTDSSVTMLSGNFVGSSAFNKLELTPTITANRVYSLGAAASTTGNLLINPSSTGANTLEVDLGGWLDTAATATTTITGNGAGPATSLLDTTSSNHNLNSGHIDIQTNGTLKGNNSNITITGSGAGGTLFTRTGTFTADTSTVIMNPNVAVNLTGTTSVAFYSLNLSPTITTGRIYTFGNATTTLAGDFSITPSAGSAVALTVNLGAGLVGATNTTISIAPTGSATANLSTTASNFPIFTGDINIATGGTLTANASTITLVATSGTAFTRAGTFTAGTSEVVFASASSTLRGFAGNSTFYDLTVNAPNSVINSSTQDTTISHNLTVASGTLASGWGSFIGPGFGSGTFTLLGGATFCLGAPFDTTSLSCEGGSVDTTARIMPIFNTYNFSSTSTVRYLADADSIIATTTFGNLVLAPVLGASRTYTSSTTALAINGDLSLTPKASAGSTGLVFNLGSSLSASGTVLIQPDSTNSPTATLSTNGSSNNLSAGYINLQSNGTLQASSTVTLTGTSGTLLTNSGTATLTGSTVVVNPNASVTLVSGATTFDNLTLSPTITSGRTYSLGSSALTINGLWDINPTAGSFITFDVNLGGTVSGSSAITIRRGGSAVPTLSTTGSNHSLTAAKIDVQTGGTFSANASTVTLTGGSAWLDGNFLYRKKITFSASTVSTNLTDFPVLVNLTSSNFDFTKAQSGGQDIRFSDSDGSTALNYEIEKWNANTQLASVWVKVPQVNASSTNDYIYMYYGDSTAADGQNASGTWDSNFKAVWHLDENPAGSAPQMSDSSGNGNSATSNSMSSSDNIAGQIASSTRFGTGGASTKYLTKADNATLDLSTAGTIEAWVYAINANNGNGIIHKGQLHAFTDEAYSLQTYSGPGVDFYINAGGGTNTFLSGSTFSQNAWHHIVGTWDGTNAKIYIDGTLDASVGSTVSVLNSSGALQIGTQTLDSPSSEAWQGNLDDPRISDIARSAAWIRAEYLNGTNAFNTFGSEESAALFKLSGGSLSSSNSTIVMNPNATSTLTQGSFAGGNAFHNLQLSPTLSGSGKAYTFGTSTVEVGHDLTINPSAASPLTLTVNLGGDLNVNGSTTITRSGSALSTLDLLRSSAPQSNFGAFNLGIFSGGTLDATGASSTISINNIWLNSGGTFNAGSSTVVFNGYVGYLLGSSTAFYNLSASDSDNNTSDSVVYFQEMATTTVNNLFSAQGINDNDRINLYSTSAGVPWGLKIGTTGSTSISYAEPKDSDASPGLTIVHTNTNDGGNNINWNFAASGISYDTQWGSSGTGNGEFSSPYGVDVDANGYVYVVDSGNNRVQVFDADGNYLNQWGTSGSGDGEFNGPTGIAVDDANNVVYVMDTGNDRVQKFDTSGNYIDQWGVNGSGDGEFIDARDIALDRDGYVWVADRRNDRVQKFVDDGTYVAQYGVSGSGVGELSRPDDIAFISSGDGYITDEQNNRVVIIEPNTPSMLNEFGTGPGSGNGEFDSPTGITADALDYLFATEFNNNRFQQFDSSGSYVDQAGSPGSGNGEFSGPVGIALNDGANYIYVVDQGNNRVQRFTIERPYTITGRVYENDQTTPVGAGKTVALRINGVLTGTGDGGVGLDDTDSSGNFLFSDVVSTPTDPLVFYLTGETEKANNITVGNGVSSLSNVFLFDDHVVLGINYTGVTTIASTLTGYDSDQNDTDMLFDAEDAGTDTLVVEPGNELHLDYQALFYPGGDVTTPSMEIGTSALYSGATETLTLTATSGTLLTTGASATFAANSNTVIMNGDGNVTLTSSPSTLTFNKLQLTPSITGNRTYTFGSSAIVTTANFDITPTSTSANTLTVNMGANISVPSAATTTISGTGAGPASAVLDVRPSSTDYNLTTGHLVIGTNGTLDATGAASTITLRGTGTGSTLLTRVGTFTAGNSTVAVTPNVSVTINSGTVTFYNLSLVPTALSGTPKTYDFGSSAVTVNNDFTINPTAASSLGLLVNMGADMTVTGTTTITRTTSATSTLDLRPSSTDYNLTTGRLNIATGGTLDATGAASNITLTSTVASTTLFTNNGTFTAGNSTVIMNPAANVNLTSGTFTGSNAFYKLQLTPNINGSDRTYTFGGAASTTNNFDIKPTAAGSYTLTVNLGGWLDVAATATTTIGTTGISATAALLQTTSANSYALNSGHLDLSSVGILTANSSTVTLTGTQNNGILFTNAGTFNSGSSTVIMNPAATVRTISGTFTGSNAFYKLQLTPTTSGTISYTFLSAASTTGNFDINPNSSNSSLFFVNAGGAIDVATGATTTITRTGNASTFLDLRPSGADYDLYTGHLNIGTGATLDAGGSASTITVKGDWTKTGSFSQGNSTVRFSGSGAQTVNNSNTFYNLSITTSAARAITFASGATTTIASGGSAIFQGASGQLLTLQASAANSTPWYFSIPAGSSRTVSYTAGVDVTASDSAVTAANSTCTRTTNWSCDTLSFSISANTAYFGILSASATKYASTTPGGDTNEVVAHTITVSNDAANGYSLTVRGAPLTNNASSTIYLDYINGGLTPGFLQAGISQFGMRVAASGGSGTVSVPYSHGVKYGYGGTATTSSQVASASGTSAATTYSVYYGANIAPETPAGAYSTSLTYILTPTY